MTVTTDLGSLDHIEGLVDAGLPPSNVKELVLRYSAGERLFFWPMVMRHSVVGARGRRWWIDRTTGDELSVAASREALRVFRFLAGHPVHRPEQALIDRYVHSVRLPGAELDGVLLSGAQLRAADLSGANLTGAHLADSDLTGADLRGAVLSLADLSGAVLDGADLTGADLSRACLADARLGGTILNGADLDHADLSGAVVRGARLESAQLREANLSSSRLREVRLDGADLIGASLQEATLDGVSLEGAKLRKANLFGAILGREAPVDLLNVDVEAADFGNCRWHQGRGDVAELAAAGRLQALQLGPRVYERSGWRPRDLVVLIRRGAIAKNLERLPEPAQRAVLSAWQRVTTFLPGSLGPCDAMVPEQVVAAVGGAFQDGWVSLVGLESVPGGVMVVLDSPDAALAVEVCQHIRMQLDLRFAEA